MSLAQLNAAKYTSPEVFRTEQERLFRKLWIFVGVRTLLEHPDSFLTHEVAGVPVVVQNCNGTLRAFENRCAHRGSAVQLETYGQRRLVCPYHGWVYDAEGRVKSIPGCDRNYGLPPDAVDQLRLSPVELACVGKLLFVNLDPQPIPLTDQFHPHFLDRLSHVSGFMDTQALLASFDGHYNWKLNFENVVDWNHVAYVHSASFAPLIPSLRAKTAKVDDRAPPPVKDAEVEDDLRSLSYEAVSPFTFRHWRWHDLIDRFVDESLYFNFFIFPNINFISMAGVIFLVQQFVPRAPDQSRITLTMTTGRKKSRIAATPAILWGHMKSEKRVIDEDIRVLEGLQRGMQADTNPAVHGHHEYALRRIAKVYDRLMARSSE